MTLDEILNLFEPTTFVIVNRGDMMQIRKLRKESDYTIIKDRKVTFKLVVSTEYNINIGQDKPYIHITLR